MPWGSGSSSAGLAVASTGVTGLAGLIGVTIPGGATTGAIDAAAGLGIAARSGFAADGGRGVFRTTAGGTGEFVLVAGFTEFTTTGVEPTVFVVRAGFTGFTATGVEPTVLVRPSKARCRASWRA